MKHWCPWGTKSWTGFFWQRSRSLTLGSFERISLLKYTCIYMNTSILIDFKKLVMAKRLSARPQAKSSMPLDLWSSKHKIVNKCNTWGALFQPQVKEYHDENVHTVVMSNSLQQESITYTGRCDENVLVRLKECRFLLFHSLEPVYSILHIFKFPQMASIIPINWYKSFFSACISSDLHSIRHILILMLY